MAVGKSKKAGSRSMIECRTCKMWVDLESCKGLTEMSQSKRNKLLKKKLFNTKVENGQKLQDHLKVFVELFEELAIIGDVIVEEERVIILLSSLPDRFSTLVTALEANEKIPAWEVVTERLLNEERRQRGGPGTSDSSEKFLDTLHLGRRPKKCNPRKRQQFRWKCRVLPGSVLCFGRPSLPSPCAWIFRCLWMWQKCARWASDSVWCYGPERVRCRRPHIFEGTSIFVEVSDLIDMSGATDLRNNLQGIVRVSICAFRAQEDRRLRMCPLSRPASSWLVTSLEREGMDC
ncbi:hypothetical protein FHG87_021159 [Trinorchestia longiramus]|nr:hypothetical protein FHG87_021159 [Trinorchestia longiramus]